VPRIGLETPPELQAIYSNAALISNTAAELVIDFVQVLPRMSKGRVLSRVILSPLHAKLLLQALGQNVANYERQFGEIRIPSPQNLADQFFRFPQREQDQDGEGE
jgi:hypothetical protein